MADPKTVDIVRKVTELRARVAAWRKAGESVALVPTMGALHEGHLSLMRLARTRARRLCVSLFVNPRQFGPTEDFAAYPRDEAADVVRLAGQGVDLLFAPGVEEMYPQGSVTTVAVKGIGDSLEGEHRPGFFAGVATIVTKLLLQAGPDIAVFGEKDYQQLLVIRRLVRDLDIPVEVLAGPTLREADGLAMSSRNAYLSAAERAQAPALHRALVSVAEALRSGKNVEAALREAKDSLAAAGFGPIDYLEARDAETLELLAPGRPGRLLAAARLGKTRLIDNLAV